MRLNSLGLQQTLGNIDDVYKLSGHMVQVFALSYPFIPSLKPGILLLLAPSPARPHSRTAAATRKARQWDWQMTMGDS